MLDSKIFGKKKPYQKCCYQVEGSWEFCFWKWILYGGSAIYTGSSITACWKAKCFYDPASRMIVDYPVDENTIDVHTNFMNLFFCLALFQTNLAISYFIGA